MPIRSVLARLVCAQELQPPGSRRRLYRPLVVGPVLLRRTDPLGPWLTDVSRDGRLRPRGPGSPGGLRARLERLQAARVACRIAAALMTPHDLSGESPPSGRLRRLRSEFYGWAIMFQPPGMAGAAVVDPDQRFPDLPAFFELPLELLDRMAFLASRGIAARPLAVVTQRDDFIADRSGRLRNRFAAGGTVRLAGGPDGWP